MAMLIGPTELNPKAEDVGLHVRYLGGSGPQSVDQAGSREMPAEMREQLEVVRKGAEEYGFRFELNYWAPPFPIESYGAPGVNHIAVVLGFKPPSSKEEQMYVPQSEYDRLMMFQSVIGGKIELLSARQWRIVAFRFAALYTPQLIDAFLEPPGFDTPDHRETLFNAYMNMLGEIGQTPYFANFLLSSKSSSLRDKIALRLTEQIVLEADKHELRFRGDPDMSHEELYKAMHKRGVFYARDLLLYVITYRREEDTHAPVPYAVSTAFLDHLDLWTRRWPFERALQRGRNFLISFFKNSGRWSDMYEEQRRSMRATYQGTKTCARKGCQVEAGLRLCGRCKTVSYCCPKHQKEDWNAAVEPHKELCFKPTF